MWSRLKVVPVLMSMVVLAGCGGDGEPAARSGPRADGAGGSIAPVDGSPGSGQDAQVAATSGTPGAPAPAPVAVARTDIAGLTKWVNPFIGTGAPDAGGQYPGNLNPAAQTPFGMVAFGPDTPGSRGSYGNGSGGYYHADTTIDFFSLTHLNGPGCRGQGALALIPGSGEMTFSHADETASPAYYKVKTANGIVNEFSATTRTGMARLTYPKATTPTLGVSTLMSGAMKHGVSETLVDLVVDKKAGVVSGKTVVGSFCGGTWYKPVYFYILFDTALDPDATQAGGGVARLTFAANPSGDATVVQVKVGISSVSVENAKLNLTTENPDWSFDKLLEREQAVWNHRLNTVQLDLAQPGGMSSLGASQVQAATDYVKQFYTALYHTLTGPTIYSDVNGDYRSMQQADLGAAPDTAPTRPRVNVSQYAVPGHADAYRTHYSGFSLWDTYRSETQLQAMLFPAETSDMMQSLVADASQCGALPHWVDGSDDTTPMEGDHAPNAIAGAFAFGARSFDTAAARKYMLQSAFGTAPSSGSYTAGACNDKPSVSTAIGSFYRKNGYVASDIAWDSHPGSMTLEMVTTDESIGNFLAALPGATRDADNIATLHKGARNWTHLYNADIPASRGYDRSYGFYGITRGLVPRDSSGEWHFDYWKNGGFHESTSPNYLWTIGHDYAALSETLGGHAEAISQLSRLFGLNPADPYDGPLPAAEILNSGESGKTLYIGNEPSLQTPWAANWMGAPQLAQRVIPIIMNRTFTAKPGGLPGNDDMGATSAWYIWASAGLYPVIPSAPGLAMSTPQFKGMTVWLADGTKKLRIETDGEALLNNKPYIKSVQLNGKPYQGSWLPLAAIANGGTLTYTLSATPTDWATDAALAPPSGPAADYTKAFSPQAAQLAARQVAAAK